MRIVPQETASRAAESLKLLFGIDATDHRPQSFAPIDARNFDLFVATDDPGRGDVKQHLIRAGVAPSKIIGWAVSDPFGGDPSEYDQCALTTTIHRLAELRRTIFGPPSSGPA
jgi:protein-tyrosine-phosphatase